MELFWSNNIEGSLVRLDREESGHCVKVLRHRAGDTLSIIDGNGSLYTCTLLEADPKQAVARIESVQGSFGAHPYRLTMAVCPTKNMDRYEWFAEKATEIGVDRIAPVIGERSERRVVKTERLERIVLSAAKQSLKGAVPQILPACSVSEFIAGAPVGALKLICHCYEIESLPREGITAALEGARGREICILIGPEGDFSPSEVELALSKGWKSIHLGESRLRTESAALVAATAVYLEMLKNA